MHSHSLWDVLHLPSRQCEATNKKAVLSDGFLTRWEGLGRDQSRDLLATAVGHAPDTCKA